MILRSPFVRGTGWWDWSAAAYQKAEGPQRVETARRKKPKGQKEEMKMNNNMKALTFEEMEKVTADGAVHNSARRKLREKIVNRIISWFD